MLNPFYKLKVYWHLFQKVHYELLIIGCLEDDLKDKYLKKALYHKKKHSSKKYGNLIFK
ncbi:hypothetical protein DFO73_1049 [Cytobacillus oceanisediminis]|uniref:Uncharacterized protein n=1 Tax=Cytobacillus oceanisediminis TaxID=665099 RepID=A0A2V2ZZI5_9BACI|nr:hypothetical protein DFO73_1049 [Cytobacillus oceanisediminis]